MVNIPWARSKYPDVFTAKGKGKDGEDVWVSTGKLYDIMESICYDQDPNSPWVFMRPPIDKTPSAKWLKARLDYSILMSHAPYHETDEVPTVSFSSMVNLNLKRQNNFIKTF